MTRRGMGLFNAYVAGSTCDTERVREIQELVRSLGGDITFDWTGGEGEIRSDWSEATARAREISERERQAVFDADVVILCGHPTRGLGSYIEVGMALAHGLPVIVFGPARESVFWYLPEVIRLTAEEDLARWLTDLGELAGVTRKAAA